MTEQEIHTICEKYNITNYTINPDGSIDVDGDVYLTFKRLSKLPLKFNKVSGNFYCSDNKLKTLEGSPKIIGGSFDCSNNNLTSLEGSPNEVGWNFYCGDNNKLTSLEGCPNEVVGGFYFYRNSLESLDEYKGSYEKLNCDNKEKLIRKSKIKAISCL